MAGALGPIMGVCWCLGREEWFFRLFFELKNLHNSHSNFGDFLVWFSPLEEKTVCGVDDVRPKHGIKAKLFRSPSYVLTAASSALA